MLVKFISFVASSRLCFFFRWFFLTFDWNSDIHQMYEELAHKFLMVGQGEGNEINTRRNPLNLMNRRNLKNFSAHFELIVSFPKKKRNHRREILLLERRKMKCGREKETSPHWKPPKLVCCIIIKLYEMRKKVKTRIFIFLLSH